MKTTFVFLFLIFTLNAFSQSCDTITNLTPESPYYMYEFSSAWGYMGGHNGNNLAEWAEKFTGTGGTFQDVLIMPGRAYAGSPSSYITLRVHNGTTAPGTVIASKQVLINTLAVDQWNKVPFDSPVTVGNEYFISFKLNYTTPQDTFVILSNSPKISNTAYLKYLVMGWMSYETFMNGQLNTSFGIAALFCDSTTNGNLVATEQRISVFPNPCSEEVHIECPDEIEKIYLISSTGQIIPVYNENRAMTVSITIPSVALGIYQIVVITTEGRVFKKDVVKN